LRFAISQNAAEIRTVHLRHDGFFRPIPGARWFPIQGEEFFTLGPPRFVWHARMRMLPLLWIEARDSLVSGQGNLAEAVWFPLALASDRIRWEPIDSNSARATLLGEGRRGCVANATVPWKGAKRC